MPRNLDNRVELLAPIEDPPQRADVLDVLERCLADDANAWVLDAGGNWHRRRPGEQPRDAQRELMERHAARATEATAV